MVPHQGLQIKYPAGLQDHPNIYEFVSWLMRTIIIGISLAITDSWFNKVILYRILEGEMEWKRIVNLKMKYQLFVWCLIGIVNVVVTTEQLSTEGCGKDLFYFDDYCYLVVDAPVHHDAAKAICMVKGATLTSLWGPDEIEFLTNLLTSLNLKANFWIGSGVVRNKWAWLDGSGSLDVLFKDTKFPEASKDVCAYLTPAGPLDFADCDVTKPAFVCKRPLDMYYVPSTVNITQNGFEIPATTSEEILFERLWPPYLDQIVLNMTSPNYLTTVEVVYEADCAYRCYTVDECQAFSVVCKSARKCNMRLCRLLSGLDIR